MATIPLHRGIAIALLDDPERLSAPAEILLIVSDITSF
jgi:hypothetical protein